MSGSLKRIGRLAPAVVAVALVSIPVAQAAAKPVTTPSAQMARHFRHEDAIYGMKGGAARTPAQAMALHFKHEDAIYEGNSPVGSSRSPAQMIALHFKHEDALYGAQRSAVGTPAAAAASDGFDWNDALVGAGGAVGVMLLSAAAVVAVQRGRGRVAQS